MSQSTEDEGKPEIWIECRHNTGGSQNGGSRSVERLVRRIHVLPVGDVEIHAAQEICWCHPTETEPRLWVHNAKDCREARERATGEKCSDGWINIAEYVPPNTQRDSPADAG